MCPSRPASGPSHWTYQRRDATGRHRQEEWGWAAMRYTSDEQRREHFRNWLRQQLAEQDFYQRRGDRYLVSEFVRYAGERGARLEEVSLGRYLRDSNPVLPTPESCRELAKALDLHPARVLVEAGYLTPADFVNLPDGADEQSLRLHLGEVEHSSILPEVIREQMTADIRRRIGLLHLVAGGSSSESEIGPAHLDGDEHGTVPPSLFQAQHDSTIPPPGALLGNVQ